MICEPKPVPRVSMPLLATRGAQGVVACRRIPVLPLFAVRLSMARERYLTCHRSHRRLFASAKDVNVVSDSYVANLGKVSHIRE